MNITELIVELLQKGQKVELSGIGTFDSMMQSPHHDAESHIYYPASRSIVFQNETTGDNGIVKIIAQRECVSDEVAEQMWRNYCDALADKLSRTGTHQFGEMGMLTKTDNSYDFTPNKGFVLDAGNGSETPLEEVKVYAHNDNDDPFAQFDDEELVKVVERTKEEVPERSAEVVAPVAEPAPEPVPAPEPEAEPMTPAEPETEAKIDDDWREALRKLDELPKSEEAIRAEEKARREREKAEAKAKEKAEKEQAKLDKLAEKHQELVDKLRDEEHEAAARREAENRRRAEEEIRNAELRAEENRRNNEKQSEAAMALAEQKAQEERIKAEKRAAILAAVAAKESASRPQAASAPVTAATPDAAAAPESATYEAPRIMSEKERKKIDKEVERRMKEDQKRQAAAAAAAEKEAANRIKEEQKREKEALKEAKKQAKLAEKEAKKAAKQASQAVITEPAVEGNDNGGKKRHGWIIILIILLVLLLGGGAAYYFLVMKGGDVTIGSKVARNGKHLDVPAENDLTYNVDMIPYTTREIEQNSDMVCRYMADYICRFIAAEGYANARVPMMDRVRQYVNERMNSLLGDRFAVQRLIPYNDYIYNHCEPWLKLYYADSARTLVQGELLNPDALEDMLNQMVDELGLQPDSHKPIAAATNEPQQAKANKAADKKAAAKKKKGDEDDNPVYVYVEKNSKQGFDIIAGFYLNKRTAAKMTAHLHDLGCDAYIIEKNEMFYVSMGSAPTRTKAEALYNHIKGWYDGDIVIKQL